jgi:ribose-phosphate pyrophosphokinase
MVDANFAKFTLHKRGWACYIEQKDAFRMFVFSPPSSRNLASKVAEKIGGSVGSLEVSRFTNNEVRLRVAEPKVGPQAVILQSICNPVDTSIVEFCFLADALTRMGVRELIAITPWLGYSKQDKVFRPGEPLSIKVVAKMLQVAPIKQLITFDLHNLAILGFFDIPVTNLTARQLFVDYFKGKLTPETVVIAPDAGSIKGSTAFAGDLDVPVVYMDKKRDLITGEVKVLGISRPVEGADVVIVDDMIVTGSTLIETAKFLRKQNVGSIRVAATHHLYVAGAEEAIETAGIDEIIVTDTIQAPVSSKNLTVLSTAGIIAGEIARLTE